MTAVMRPPRYSSGASRCPDTGGYDDKGGERSSLCTQGHLSRVEMTSVGQSQKLLVSGDGEQRGYIPIENIQFCL